MQTNDEFLDVLDRGELDIPEFWQDESWQKMLDLLAEPWDF